MRIAVGGLHNESSTFSPVPVERDEFRVLEGEALLADPHVAALTRAPNVRPVGTLFARAPSGGPMRAETHDALLDRFRSRLADAGPLDGLWLAMHGGAASDGSDDPEGDWIEAAREVLGPDAIIVASFDTHGALSERATRTLDGAAAFRTAAPHVDVEETHARAIDLIVRAVRTGTRPVLASVRLPLLVPSERAASELPAARDLFRFAETLEARVGVRDASLLLGAPFGDLPRAGATALVVGDGPSAASDAALALARELWSARDAFDFSVPSGPAGTCLRDARALAAKRPAGPAVVSDCGDVPGAGGVGDRADVLCASLAAVPDRDAGPAVVFAGIAAPDTVADLAEAGVGTRAEVRIGDQLGRVGGPVATVTATVAGRTRTETHGALVRLTRGALHLVVAERRGPPPDPTDLIATGLDLDPPIVVVIKAGYLPDAWARLAAARFMAVEDGATTHDLTRLAYRRIRRPVHPLEPVPDPFAGDGPPVVLSRPGPSGGRTRPESRRPAG